MPLCLPINFQSISNYGIQFRKFHFCKYSICMGCENSQAAGVMPQQPHVLEQSTPHVQPTPQSCPAPVEASVKKQKLSEVIFGDKENQTPKELNKMGLNIQNEAMGVCQDLKKPTSQTKLKSKSENRKSEVPMLDKTNTVTSNFVMEDKKKVLSSLQGNAGLARPENKLESEADVGPSIKSIQAGVNLKEQNLKQDQIEEHCVPRVVKKSLMFQELNPYNIVKIEQDIARPSEQMCRPYQSPIKQKTFSKSRFALEHWEKTQQEEKVSRTDKLIEVDQLILVRQEVNSYLNEIWDYEKDVLDSIIAIIEEKEHKQFQGIQVLITE